MRLVPRRFPLRTACVALLALLPGTSQAQPAPSGCAMLSQAPSLIRPASLKPGPGELAITFVAHSTFVIESPGGVRAATDYSDYSRPRQPPDIATMNKAHGSHYTLNPDPAIRHVLHGWGERGAAAHHDLKHGDLRVRNVTTNIRDFGNATEYEGNSIFVFETAGLCVAHLGHLHHTLSPEKLGELGKIDILMVPVDGSWTMDQGGMVEVLEAIRPQVILPMHFFSGAALERFIHRLGGRFEIDRRGEGSMLISRATLPAKPTMVVLPGGF